MEIEKVFTYQWEGKTHVSFITYTKDGQLYEISVPESLSAFLPKLDKKGKLWMGRYRYNEEKDIWEKISRILSFLKGMVDLIKNIFRKTPSVQ